MSVLICSGQLCTIRYYILSGTIRYHILSGTIRYYILSGTISCLSVVYTMWSCATVRYEGMEPNNVSVDLFRATVLR